MLYKVTPMMPSPEGEKVRKAKEPGLPRKRRKTAIYDAEGNEVLITLMCLKCKAMKPLAMFGLRKMADGAIRNQPWCRTCRGGTGVKKKGEVTESVEAAESSSVQPAQIAEPINDEASVTGMEAAVMAASVEATAHAESVAMSLVDETTLPGDAPPVEFETVGLLPDPV